MTAAEMSPTGLAGERLGSEFAELSRVVKRAGLLRRRYGYYAVRIGVNLALLGATAVAFVVLGDTWWQLFTALVVALVLTQFAFIGHDAGHRQIFVGRRANDLVGYTHSAITGISYQWWVGKHNRHHANPNQEDEDPDIDIPAIAFSRDQARAKRGLVRWVALHQAPLFFPLLLTEAVMLRISSVEAVLRREIKFVRLEAVLIVGHLVVYLAAVFLVLPPGKAVLFIVVHQGVMGVYLGCSFAPNHKGMPILAKDVKLDFLRKQVLTSRNIQGGRWVDFLLGGLNHQIEHHLFPSMPRPNLRRARPVVREFCVRRGVSYSQCGLLHSYAQVLRHLYDAGAPLRPATGQAADKKSRVDA
ncbi:fatty acid desaturase family protein [Actinokineospora sp.]|uniref:fatty acid desaturase family protein n=1 Tax=Actinokineospora sp. TaxID=1872133 RepID=UPI0040384326